MLRFGWKTSKLSLIIRGDSDGGDSMSCVVVDGLDLRECV